MTRPVVTVWEDRALTGILPLFSQHGFHPLPVADRDDRLMGIVSEHDLVQPLEMALQADGVSH